MHQMDHKNHSEDPQPEAPALILPSCLFPRKEREEVVGCGVSGREAITSQRECDWLKERHRITFLSQHTRLKPCVYSVSCNHF